MDMSYSSWEMYWRIFIKDFKSIPTWFGVCLEKGLLLQVVQVEKTCDGQISGKGQGHFMGMFLGDGS